jgi:serine protease AprX
MGFHWQNDIIIIVFVQKEIPMQKHRITINLIAILAILLASLGNVSLVAMAGQGDEVLKADPRLLQMAEENPEAVFMVIVQKEAKNKDLKDDDPEVAVEKGGGKVTKQLDLIVSFSAEMTGKELTKLAKNPKVRWISADAPMVSTTAPGMNTVLDVFASKSYSLNAGTLYWSGSWTESGESTDPSKGAITVATINRCSGGSGYCLRIDPDPAKTATISVSRQANLSGASSAILSFYRKNEFNVSVSGVAGVGEAASLQISADGGVTWTTLQTYTSTQFTGEGVDSFDISTYASGNTQIRFLITSKQSGYRFLYIDDVQIEYANASAFVSAVKADQLDSLNGSGVTVAVIDSGIAYHNDLKISGSNKSRIIGNEYFTGSGGSEDLFGHGTHVAGIIGGTGSMSSGKYRGMAPGVNLVNLKVADKDGMTYESDVVEAFQWVYNNKTAYNIRVVNLSMNSTVAQSYHTSPLAAAAEILWFNSIVVVVSAGNNGTGSGPVTIYPPANDPFVITVGATEDMGTTGLGDDNLAVFSAYGLTIDGFTKPDLVAPGRNVVAPLADKASTVYTAHPLHRVGDYYFRMSGTSMSAPVVSGAVALLLQDEPNLNPDQVKYRLMATANKNNWNFDNAKSGAGYLDVYAAVNGTTSDSANQGILVSQMLTTGSDPVTWGSVGWNSVGWNSVGWNSVGWNSVGWNSVGWNSVGWNSVGWNSVGWNSSTWDD